MARMEGLAVIGHVVYDDDTVSSSVVRRGDRPEPLLTRCVPLSRRKAVVVHQLAVLLPTQSAAPRDDLFDSRSAT